MKIVFNSPTEQFSKLEIGATFKVDPSSSLLYMKIVTTYDKDRNSANTILINNGTIEHFASHHEVIPVNGTWSQEV